MILVTGSSGFIGSALVSSLSEHNHFVKAASRNPNLDTCTRFVRYIKNGEINSETDWSEALDAVHVVVHVAGHAHSGDFADINALNIYRDINTFGTINLAHQAAQNGVKRFIYISSIKVNGESSLYGNKFTYDDAPNPKDNYGISKYEAERGLFDLAYKSEMEIVIIRPPLVYGPGVKANFLALLCFVNFRIPLPFKGIKNKKSFVFIKNLTDFIEVCITHPKAKNKIFLVSDNQDVTMSCLLKRIGCAFGKPAILFSPILFLKPLKFIFNKSLILDKLFGSLEVDICQTMELLGWSPPFSLEDGLALTVESFFISDRKK